MQLGTITNEFLEPFIGGQLEIQNQIEEYLFRGEIESVEVIKSVEEDTHDELRVRFAWFAKGEGYPPLPSRWVKEDNLDYELGLKPGFTQIIDIGSSSEGSNRFCIQSVISNEVIVFFAPGEGMLDRAVVEDLELVTV